MQILALSSALFVSEGGAAGSRSGLKLTRYLSISYSVINVIYHQASHCLSLSFNYPTDTRTHTGGKLSDRILETESICHFHTPWLEEGRQCGVRGGTAGLGATFIWIC